MQPPRFNSISTDVTGIRNIRVLLASVFYYTFRRWLPVKKYIVVLESGGRTVCMGDPYFIAKHSLNHPQYARFQFIIVGNKRDIRPLTASAEHTTIRSCPRHSVRYCYWLAVAGFLINDYSFPLYFSRREEQRYLLMYSKIPLTDIGRSNDPCSATFSNLQRNVFHATHLLSPGNYFDNEFSKELMLGHGCNTKIIHGGYPRNDVFYSAKTSVRVITGDTLVNIALLPNWCKYENISSDSTELSEILHQIDDRLPEGYKVWLDQYAFSSETLETTEFQNINYFPDDYERYSFLSRCDILVSGLCVELLDFSLTSKPAFLFLPERRQNDAGTNQTQFISGFPHKVIGNTRDLISVLKDAKEYSGQPGISEDAFRKRYRDLEHGESTARLCSHFLLENDALSERSIIKNQDKKNLLVYAGSLLVNGITASLKNLLDEIDKDKYNLVLWIDCVDDNSQAEQFISRIDKRISFIPARHWRPLDVLQLIQFSLASVFPSIFSGFYRDRLLWRSEYERRFGATHFDCIVHYTGYNRNAAMIMCSSGANKIIYMHNDMMREHATRKNYLAVAIKEAYRDADAIVTVRPGLEKSYCDEVEDIKQKTIYLPNLVSRQYLELAKNSLHESFARNISEDEAKRVVGALEKDGVYRFINLARFSPEKGQLRLIQAYENLYSTTVSTQLFIMGAHGDLYEEIVKKALNSRAADSIYVLRGSWNPFPLLARMDTFVIASYYEGLPMAIFECLALGVSVITTDIPGPADFLSKGYGTVVPNSVEGLISGMKRAMEDGVGSRTFDVDSYNQDALSRFYELIEGIGRTNRTLENHSN